MHRHTERGSTLAHLLRVFTALWLQGTEKGKASSSAWGKKHEILTPDPNEWTTAVTLKEESTNLKQQQNQCQSKCIILRIYDEEVQFQTLAFHCSGAKQTLTCSRNYILVKQLLRL